MLTAAWEYLKPHAIQSALWRCKSRFAAVVAGRGSGKTTLARRRIVQYLAVKKPWADPIYAYCLPTREQAKRIVWPKLKELIPRNWVKTINETELKIETVFGSCVYVFGMDKPHRAEGLQYDGVVIDESSDQKPSVFNTTILPALSHRRAWCWRIGAAKRFGIGARDFRGFFIKGMRKECINNDPTMRIESFEWSSEDIVDETTIAFAKATLDSKDYNEQYRAKWEETGGSIYHGYHDTLNVSTEAAYNPALPIVIGSDFNVNPMSWVLAHRFPNKLHIFDEIFLRNVSTGDTLNYLYQRYGGHKAGFQFFGDATGKARKTAADSAAFSDYIQIKNDARFKGAKVYYPSSNPSITDRFASVNAMLCNTIGERRLLINPKCERLRNDLMQMTYIEYTREPDERNKDSGHITDALGYIVHFVYPLKALQTEATAHIQSFTHAPSIV